MWGSQEEMAKNIFLKYFLFLSLIVLHLKCSRNQHIINVNAASLIPILFTRLMMLSHK